ncbi:2-polyprenyl-3-methyl-6-methoxy-1,4-benzoquinone monooxygenase [Neisseria sp. Ec49-e6-T10]|uniref:2-polyprenyl-3-methyl-6-methoxy-1,4-benzoquinone monooxygenase n=1 Tax=Neisseria sp. Ec49-e6-T10 TaxID=3140744 RepID=UPI003EBD325B
MLDKVIENVDVVLRTLFAPAHTIRPYPDQNVPEAQMTEKEKKHALGLMRVNHCGEVCAQALYQGQALTARTQENKEAFKHAAQEEVEHLAWTEKRIRDLGGNTSLFNPLWYMGSLAIGVSAGLLGDKWNLGFLEETENQVGAHLGSHLKELPEQDAKSRAIVTQMQEDELKHEHMARDFGAAALPFPVKAMMKLSAKAMTTLSYKF